MPTDTSIKSPEPIQPNVEKNVGTSSANPPNELTTIEITDASDRPKIAEDENLSTSPPDATKVSPQAIQSYVILTLLSPVSFIRYHLRKHLHKSKGLTIQQLKMTLLMLIPNPLILQLSQQLIVRNSYAHSYPFITNIN